MTNPFGETKELLPGDGSALLFTDFLDRDAADGFFNELSCSIPWESTAIPMFGRDVIEPRLSAWIADDGVSYRYSGRNRTVHPWNETLALLRARVEEVSGATFNGVLVNLYRNGNDHMGWHADDERSLGSDPIIASVSLGASRRFDFRHRETNETVTTLLTHGSLLVMSGAVQSRWKHRIPKTAKISAPRINLTFRLLV